ncbi:14-3-3-like protein D [Diospyros lotus]|uniref:14-3-3-like protein D n=1 Tax=Diospyros lotus TaxID=55363 RepID=UPI002255B19D|nr:14-3-3-like protein D [Diospyros lotus]
METRSHCLYMAKLAQHAGRYDDMLKFMENLVTRFISAGSPLTPDERSLLFAACKNQTGSLRDALHAMPPKDGQSGHASLAGNYGSKAESELFELCARILMLLDSHLMPSASASESRVFYLKMKGDCHRYLAECKNGSDTKRAVDAAMAAYKLAEEIAKAELAPTHPTRLSLMLNFAVFYHDTLREPEYACGMAREAFDEAAAQPSRYKSHEGTTASAAHITQLLRENYALWVSNM